MTKLFKVDLLVVHKTELVSEAECKRNADFLDGPDHKPLKNIYGFYLYRVRRREIYTTEVEMYERMSNFDYGNDNREYKTRVVGWGEVTEKDNLPSDVVEEAKRNDFAQYEPSSETRQWGARETKNIIRGIVL